MARRAYVAADRSVKLGPRLATAWGACYASPLARRGRAREARAMWTQEDDQLRTGDPLTRL